MRTTTKFLFLIIIFLQACKPEPPTHVFQISGKLKNYQQEKIILQFDEADSIKTLLIADKKNGTFSINSIDSLQIGQYFLKIGNDSSRVPLFIDNTDIVVKLDKQNLSNSFTRGKSKYQQLYYNYRSGCYNAANLFNYQKSFVAENKNSILGAIALKEMLGETQWRLKQTLILYEELDSTIQNGNLGREINNYITLGLENIKKSNEDKELQIEKNTRVKPVESDKKETKTTHVSKMTISKYAPYFYGNGLDGNEISAKEVFSKNKVTLIDFWASWCVPCRAQNPDFVQLYKKYHSKGFEILSVAEDKEDADWKNAIIQDNMTWQHVNDDYKRIANMYNVGAIPYAVLVNKQGGIIAEKIGSGKLKRLLYEEFGY